MRKSGGDDMEIKERVELLVLLANVSLYFYNFISACNTKNHNRDQAYDIELQ